MRENITGSSPGFVCDHEAVVHLGNGRQIDWTKIGDEYRQGKQIVKVNGAVAGAATSITVDALPVDLPIGTILNFGNYAPVTVQVNDADVNAGETAFGVDALSGPLPAGAVLDFGVQLVKLSAAAAAGATSLTVEALETDIADDDTATFPGGTISARLTAPAAKGATTLTVDEVPFPIADDAEATFGGTGSKRVPAGTIMAELTGGKLIPRKSVTGSETAVGVLVSDAAEEDHSQAKTGFGVYRGGSFYKELLPDRGEAAFLTWVGEINTFGPGFVLETYSDSRAA